MDLGTLFCWGSNSIGRQSEPCVFHLIPARKPNPVFNCSALNQTNRLLKIKCQPGFDGGIMQVRILFGSSYSKYAEFNIIHSYVLELHYGAPKCTYKLLGFKYHKRSSTWIQYQKTQTKYRIHCISLCNKCKVKNLKFKRSAKYLISIP